MNKKEHIEPDAGAALTAFIDNSQIFLQRTMAAIVITIAIDTIYGYLYGHSEKIWMSTVYSLIVVGISYREIMRGYIRRGVGLFCWGTWLGTCLYAFVVAGIRTPLLILIPPMIMIIAWSQGRRYLYLMFGMTTLFFVAYVVSENNNWLPPPIVRTATSMFITYMCVTANASIIAMIIAENFKRLVNNGEKLTTDLEHRLSDLKVSDDALRNLNNDLEQRVAERTFQYNEANRAQQNLIEKLELAQKELVQSEKLASLGSMVAGISHELNTPIGNALTLTSSLENLFLQLKEIISSGQVRRSELDELLQSGTDMAALATKSTRRAVDLMASFKQVAVDQTSEQRRIFNLYNVIEDNLTTLLPSIKKQRKTITFCNKVEKHIECDSFPGPFGQIIVNLTQNAILHGFEGRDLGSITIESEDLSDVVLLTVTDDGIGMEPSILVHVFDPFFTTKLGNGGSGIGLSISYRIATSILGGNLTAKSMPERGSKFTLTIPKIAPYKF